MSENNEKRNVVAEHNTLVEAYKPLSLGEQRVLYLAVSRLNPTLPAEKNEKVHRILGTEYAKAWNLDDSLAYRQLRQAVNKLYERSVYIQLDSGEEDDFRWIERKGIYKAGSGYAEIHFTDSVMPFLTDLRGNHTAFLLGSLCHLTTPYAVNLFTVLSRFRDKGWRAYKDLEAFKLAIGVKSKQERWAAFQRDILSPAVSQICSTTDLFVEYDTIKTGRKVTGIHFTMRRQEVQEEFAF